MTDPGAVAAASLDAFPAQLAILDDDGVIVYTNRAWREFGEANALDDEDPDSIGVNYLEVCESAAKPRPPAASGAEPDEPRELDVPGSDASDARDGAVAADGIRSVLETESETFEFEYPCHGPDGERWFTMRASRFEHAGEPWVLVLHLDITARKLAERATQQRAARLRNLAQVLSHDLRNPLAVASGFTDLLADELGTDDRLERLETALDRMDRIIEDALVLARQERVDDADLLPVSLADAAEQAWETVDTKDATLHVEDSLAFVANPTLLRHVFENLFRNAVDHAGTDVTVTVGAIAAESRPDGAPTDDGPAAGFFVEDDGLGIPPDDREDVFESGFTTAEEGTGLGLSIVTRIADAHGWDCRVTAARHAESGARFEVTGVERRDG